MKYLDFHPHLHALVADGMFTRDGKFHVMAEVTLRPLEELFRARMITFLVEKDLLPPATSSSFAPGATEDKSRPWLACPT